MYTKEDEKRINSESGYRIDDRSQFRRDYDRLIHSTCFRRLQGKTQLYPCLENDFFRNRLTHSLEVAQVAKSIAIKLNKESSTLIAENSIDTDVVEFSGLAHDLGHPPFGHQGEAMLNELMFDDGGFEGNAQTLRLLTRIEKKGLTALEPKAFAKNKDTRFGLNITARSLASILKYDKVIPKKSKERNKKRIEPVKGYYYFDEETVNWIKNNYAVKHFLFFGLYR